MQGDAPSMLNYIDRQPGSWVSLLDSKLPPRVASDHDGTPCPKKAAALKSKRPSSYK